MSDRDDILPGPGFTGAADVDEVDDIGALGDLFRQVAMPPGPVDLAARVRAGIGGPGQADSAEDDLIDELYDGGSQAAAAADPRLAKLAQVVRQAARPRRQADLLPRIHDRLDAEQVSRRHRVADLDAVTRWRIWTAVIGGHLAALLALAALHVTVRPMQGGGDATAASGHTYLINTTRIGEGADSGMPAVELPEKWSGFRHHPELLFALRSSADRRQAARVHYGSEGSERTVAAALNWLQERAAATGLAGTEVGAEQLAVDGLLALALLGEGLEDRQRRLAAVTVLERLGQGQSALEKSGGQLDSRALGIVAAAQVEGALLFDDNRLREQAEATLRELAIRDVSPGPAGLGGFTLLAVRTARIAGIDVPQGLDRRIEDSIARPLPAAHADPGRRGLAAFARITEGARASVSAAEQIRALGAMPPDLDSERRIDLATWFFPTLALREVGGEPWYRWNDHLHGALLRSFSYGDGQAHIPAERVAQASAFGSRAEEFATALAILQLQAAYRYLPVAVGLAADGDS